MDKGEPIGKSFIVPINDGERNKFVSLSKGAAVDFAMVVFVGRTVSGEDVFKKVVDAGIPVLPSSHELLGMLTDYIASVAKLKIGDVVRLDFDEHGKSKFEKQSNPRAARERKKIP